MHRQPLIGISGSMNTEENQYHINRDYVRSLTEAGAIPLLLAPDMTDEQARQCAEAMGLSVTSRCRIVVPTAVVNAAGAAAGDQGGTDEFTEMLRRRQASALSRSASSG